MLANCLFKRVVVLVPMIYSKPDGTITAGLGVRQLLTAWSHLGSTNLWDSIFCRINDRINNVVVRWFVRWFVLHVAAVLEAPAIKIFTSHHSPFFASGHLVVIHDVTPFRMPKRYPLQTIYTRCFLSTVMKSADGVITISQHVRDALVEMFPEVKYRLCVIPSFSPKINFVDKSSRLGGIKGSGKFIMVGLTRRHKNLDWAAQATEEAGRIDSRLSLHAVGVWHDFWPDVVVASERSDRVTKLTLDGYVSNTQLDELYRDAAALLYLSTDEGMGLPPLEAFARGCPVICSDIPVLREVCGEAAFYVKLGDVQGLADLMLALVSGRLDGEIIRKHSIGLTRIERFSEAALREEWMKLMASYEASKHYSVL